MYHQILLRNLKTVRSRSKLKLTRMSEVTDKLIRMSVTHVDLLLVNYFFIATIMTENFLLTRCGFVFVEI